MGLYGGFILFDFKGEVGMDKVFLRGMKVETLIGVYDWEREQPQTLLLDIEIGVQRVSALSDQIGDTVHYGEVCEAVRQGVRVQRFMLLEALAEYVADLVLQDFAALWVKVKVVKLGILPDVREVGVEIERSAESGANV